MGYMGLGGAQKGDRLPALNAAFFMGRPGSKRNRFPVDDVLPGFRTAVEAYYSRMEELGQQLLPLYAIAAGMAADHFGQFFDPSLATLRMDPLPARARFGRSMGHRPPHCDAGFMTLLPTNGIGGLEIRGDHGWFAVAQEPQILRRQRRRHPEGVEQRPLPIDNASGPQHDTPATATPFRTSSIHAPTPSSKRSLAVSTQNIRCYTSRTATATT